MSPAKLKLESMKDTLTDPFSVFDEKMDEDTFIEIGRALIKKIGPKEYLRRVLSNIRKNVELKESNVNIEWTQDLLESRN